MGQDPRFPETLEPRTTGELLMEQFRDHFAAWCAGTLMRASERSFRDDPESGLLTRYLYDRPQAVVPAAAAATPRTCTGSFMAPKNTQSV